MAAKERFVLCRNTVNPIGAPLSYCGRPIKQRNTLDWCDGCRAILPVWPQAEVEA